MRDQTAQMQRLLKEFKELKESLFGNSTFVVLNQNDAKTQRYNQLLQFFYPSFRTKDFVSPIK